MRRHVPFLQADPQTPIPLFGSVTASLAEVEKAGHVNSARLKKTFGFEQRLLPTGNN